MNISSPFIIRPIATSLLMVALFISGILSYQFLPISSLPEVDYPTIKVSSFYPGASPSVMASSVTAPLERQFGQMPGLNQMNSISSRGLSLITLQFDLNLSLDIAEQEVQAAINAASSYLPGSMPNPPIYSKVNPADTPIITLSIASKTLPLSKLEDLAETRLTQKISQISGVGLVSISGGQRPAIRIKANSNALNQYGLSTSDIRDAVTASNVNGAKGNFDGESIAYDINSNDQLLSAKDYADLIIAYKNNAPIRLKDIASAVDDIENIYQAAWVGKEPAIIVNVQRQPGANVIKVADNIKALLPKLSSTLPSDVKVSVLSDRTTAIRASVTDVEFELLLSVLLVIIVMFCFLRSFSATIIPSVAVPLSLIGTFCAMYLFGFSLNNLTLMALTIATGFVVDDAIVMIENIARYIEMGEKPLAAAFKGAKQIAFTIISLTISLIAVLIPLLFMEDVIGRLFREFAITLATTIILSAFISLTLTPMLCAKLLKYDTAHGNNKITRWLESSLNRLIDGYGKSLKSVLKKQPVTIIIAITTLLITCLLFYTIPKGFFPTQNTGMIQGISEIRQDTSFNNIAVKQQELVDIVSQDPDIESISSFIGIDGINTTLNSGRMLLNLKDFSKEKKDVHHIIKRIQSKISHLSGISLYLQPVQDLSIDNIVSRSQYQYSLSSHDSDEVLHYSSLLFAALKQYPNLKDIANDQQGQGLETYIEINRDVASMLGVTVQNIVDSLYDIFGQRQISTIFTERNQYHVVLEGDSTLKNNSIGEIKVKSASGKLIPLILLAKISEKPSNLVLTRQNQFPISTISFNLSDDASLGEAVEIFEESKRQIKIPQHIECNFQGTAAAFVKASTNQVWLIIAAIIVVYIVLGILYESYIHPITILSTLPSACMGGLLALILCGKDLDIISVIGIILLIGIVKKNAIMMIDFALEQERVYNKTSMDAIFEACILRFRPILMTTAAAILAAIPLVFSNSIGSEIRTPLGITIIGGLAMSQILTLYTTPVIYLAFEKLARKFSFKRDIE